MKSSRKLFFRFTQILKLSPICLFASPFRVERMKNSLFCSSPTKKGGSELSLCFFLPWRKKLNSFFNISSNKASPRRGESQIYFIAAGRRLFPTAYRVSFLRYITFRGTRNISRAKRNAPHLSFCNASRSSGTPLPVLAEMQKTFSADAPSIAGIFIESAISHLLKT